MIRIYKDMGVSTQLCINVIYVFIKVVNFSLDWAASTAEFVLNRFLGFLELLDDSVVNFLGLQIAKETLGSKEMFDHAV